MVETFSAPVRNAHWMDKDAIRFYVKHRSQKLIPGAEIPERVECSHSLSGDWIPEWTGVSPEIFPLVTRGKFHFGFLFSVPSHLSETPRPTLQYFFSILSPGCSEHLYVWRFLPSEHLSFSPRISVRIFLVKPFHSDGEEEGGLMEFLSPEALQEGWTCFGSGLGIFRKHWDLGEDKALLRFW